MNRQTGVMVPLILTFSIGKVDGLVRCSDLVQKRSLKLVPLYRSPCASSGGWEWSFGFFSRGSWGLRSVVNFTITGKGLSCTLYWRHFSKVSWKLAGISEASYWSQKYTTLILNVTLSPCCQWSLYNGCVFSGTNAPGIALLQERMDSMDLLLPKLQEEADGCYIFPPRAFFKLRSAKRLGAVLWWWHGLGGLP